MSSIRKSLKMSAMFAVALLALPLGTLAQHYQQTNLVSDLASFNPVNVDPNLQNSWGLVHGPGGPWWVSDNNDGKSTLYDGAGNILSLVVTVSNAPSQPAPGSPTGIVFNGSETDFLLAPSSPAIFIWVTEDGTISGWNPGVNSGSAVIKVDHSQVPNATDGAVYKGATIDVINGHTVLLVSNFRSGQVEVYDTNFHQVHLPLGSFEDLDISSGYAPFNIQGIGPNIYVTYAKQNAAKHDDVAGPGNGFVDVYTNEGKLILHLQPGRWMNAPWGVTLPPAEFGVFTHAILIGNFGNGTIAAFNPVSGQFLGNVLNTDGSALSIDGLWALSFGDGQLAGPGNTMYFTAGPNGELDGLYGTLTPIASELDVDNVF